MTLDLSPWLFILARSAIHCAQDTMDDSPSSSRRPPWISWSVRILGGLLLLAFCVWLWKYRDFRTILEWQEDIDPLLFFTLLAILPAFGFPVTPFFVFAGATYGLVTGLGGSWIAIAVNLALSYWVARSGLRPTLIRIFRKTGIRMPDVKADNEVKFTVLVKLAPGVPAFAKNYLLGLADVPFRTFFWISLPITAAYASPFIILGDSVLDRDLGTTAWAVGILVVLIGGYYAWRRWKGTPKGDSNKESSEAPAATSADPPR